MRIFRRLYMSFMHIRGKHVLAPDCWCKPTVESHESES